jgi:hypothetical protein
MKVSIHLLLLAVAAACSTGNPPQQEARSFADTASVRRVITEQPPAAEPETVVVEEPLSTPHRSPQVYHRGPKGGCYTYTASGRKRYVDHSFCSWSGFLSGPEFVARPRPRRPLPAPDTRSEK